MSVRLSFHGASRTVTGSCFLLDTGRTRLVVDCGMFQGSKTLKELNYGAFPFRPERLDAVLLTHAHIDHSGLLPKLVKDGFHGAIHATAPTVDLCAVMLPDSAHIQESEVMNLNRRNEQRGRPPVEPIYGKEDAEETLTLMRACRYEEWVSVSADVRARYWNAAHLLGSASIEVEVLGAGRNGGPLRILFSGDIGPDHKLLHPDPEAPEGFDHIICESTYGDTDREDPSPEHRRAGLVREVRDAAAAGGALVVPSFAVERTQEFLTDFHMARRAGEIPDVPIFIDSPLAIKASEIFARHAHELDYGADLREALSARELRYTESVEQSKAIARLKGFHVIMAASGMAEAGRIRHHLKRWLWRRDATVLFIGYQAHGTLGRLLRDGAPTVRIQGEEVHVRARIRALDEYSGHADGQELVAWLKERGRPSGAVFLVHGEDDALTALRTRLSGDYAPEDRVVIPAMDECYELQPGGYRRVETGTGRRIEAEAAGRLDWHNDLSALLIDISAGVEAAADERGRQALLRRIRRALSEDGGPEAPADRHGRPGGRHRDEG